MRITQTTETTTTIELTDADRSELAHILSRFRTFEMKGSRSYALSLALSYGGIDSYMTKRGRA